tara:strand:+ start:59 stop:184 length:126 start_codon:yes stop_codon:yes gene_type:complete
MELIRGFHIDPQSLLGFCAFHEIPVVDLLRSPENAETSSTR